METKTNEGIYPLGRCNNCHWYYEVEDVKECPRCKTNAYLMDMPELAAAPKLLEALKEILLDLQDGFIAQDSHRGDVNRRKHQERIEKAISKAEGKL